MAPELAQAGDEYAALDVANGQVDVYSYGILLWVIATAEEPYHQINSNPFALMAQVVAVDVQAFADRDIAVFGRAGVGQAAGLVVRNVRAQDFSIYVDATHARYAQKLLHTCAGAEI